MFLAKKLNRGVGTPAAPADAQFNYVTMLLHGDGTNGAQNNTFLDSSTNNFTITRNGNTTQGSFSPYGSNWSNSFDGTSDYIETPSSSAFAFGTGNYTIEGWIFINVMPSSGNIYQIFNFTDDKENLSINSSGTLNYFNGSTGTSSTATVSVGTWTHIAYTRSSTTIKAYINNTEVISASSSGNYTSNRIFVIGARAAATKGANCLNGYLSNVRVLKGTALTSFDLTTNLTAITNTVLLTCQSNRFVDNSSSPLTLTVAGNTSVQRFNPFGTSTAYSTSVIGGSGYFDGSGDWIETSSTQIIPASTTYTVEAWVYLTGDYSDYREIVTQGGGGNANRWLMFVNITDGILKIQTGSTSITTSFTVPKNTWTHLAFVNNSGSYTVYANGTSVGSGTNTVTPQNTYVTVGAFAGGSEYFQGYISNVRITNTAVYTSAFTPNTAPFTAISGTSLLLLTTNGAIFDNAMMSDLETVGNAQISTSVKKFGTGSLAFDGTGDYLVPNSPTTDLYAFGTGDFTIEFWLYLNSVSGYIVPYDGRASGANSTTPTIYLFTATPRYYVNGADRITGSSLSTGQWYHIAVARSGTSTKLFVNGTQAGSTYTDSIAYTNTINRPIIGGDGNAPNTNLVNGYIDDLRITKGYARYTANFTAPTAAFSDTGPY